MATKILITVILLILAVSTTALRIAESEIFFTFNFTQPINTQAWNLGRKEINADLRDLLQLTNTKISFIELLQTEKETKNQIYSGVYGIGLDPYYNNTIINHRKQLPISNHVGHTELMAGECYGEFVEGTLFEEKAMNIKDRLELYCPIIYNGKTVGFYGIFDVDVEKDQVTEKYIKSRLRQMQILQRNIRIALFK